MLSKERASFGVIWLENVKAVVSCLFFPLGSLFPGYSSGKKLSKNFKSFVILRSGEGLTSSSKNNGAIFSGK